VDTRARRERLLRLPGRRDQGDPAFTKLPWPLSPSQSPWTAGLLISGDNYAFKLQACKGADCGAFSNVAAVTAP
jgi:hypothetical protein